MIGERGLALFEATRGLVEGWLKAMIALAGYLRTGLPQIGLTADVERANDLLQDAASIFNDKDAQFELAKVQLAADAECFVQRVHDPVGLVAHVGDVQRLARAERR